MWSGDRSDISWHSYNAQTTNQILNDDMHLFIGKFDCWVLTKEASNDIIFKY